MEFFEPKNVRAICAWVPGAGSANAGATKTATTFCVSGGSIGTHGEYATGAEFLSGCPFRLVGVTLYSDTVLAGSGMSIFLKRKSGTSMQGVLAGVSYNNGKHCQYIPPGNLDIPKTHDVVVRTLATNAAGTSRYLQILVAY